MVSAQWSALKGASLPQHEMLADVRFGSKADICAATSHVRFTPNSDRKSRHAQTVMSALPPKADMCSALAYVCFGPKEDTRTSSKTSNWSSMSGNVLSPVAFGVQSPRTQSGLSKRGQLRKGVSRGPLGLALFFPCKCRVWVCAPTARGGVACEGLGFFRSNGSLANHFVNFAERRCGWPA